MSEHELREGLRSAVAEEPPLAFDADRLVEQAERTVRRRRSLFGVAAATVVVAAGAIAVPLALGGTAGQHTVQAAAPALVTSAPPPGTTTSAPAKPKDISWPPAGTAPADYTAAQLTAAAGAFTQHLDAVLPKLVPTAEHPKIGPWGGETAGLAAGQRYLDAAIHFTVGGKSSSAAVQVNGPGDDDTYGPATACENTTTCVRTVQADGSELVVATITAGSGPNGTAQLASVSDFRPDGTIVSATGYNYDYTSRVQMNPTTPDVTLSIAQLTTLATDPQLHL